MALTREGVLARINLFAVLHGIQELVVLDEKSRELIKGTKLTLEFLVKGCGRGALVFRNGGCDFHEGKIKKADIRLYFTSAEHFNKMVNGQANPIPLKGFGHIGFLKGTFSTLADRLSSFLRPAEGALDNPDFFAVNTRLTAFVAFHALSEIANYDEVGRINARHIPDGVFQLRVLEEGGPTLNILVRDGRLSTRVGVDPTHRCLMWFQDLKALADLINNNIESYALFAMGRGGVRGFIPMADKTNPILGLIPGYLS